MRAQAYGLNVTAIVRGRERYVVIYYDQQAAAACAVAGRWAADPALSFTWHDAARFCQKIREQTLWRKLTPQAEPPPPPSPEGPAAGGLFSFLKRFVQRRKSQ
jgi:hypothetical protein